MQLLSIPLWNDIANETSPNNQSLLHKIYGQRILGKVHCPGISVLIDE